MQQETHVQHTTTEVTQPADAAAVESTTTTTQTTITQPTPAVTTPESVNVNTSTATSDGGQQLNVSTQPGVTSVNINEG